MGEERRDTCKGKISGWRGGEGELLTNRTTLSS